jgi:hypothetical protein
LLPELHFYGTRGIYEDCFRSYLTNRKQKVEVKSPNTTQKFFSDGGTLKHGVPQGSIQGPLLFVIYKNDLPLRINAIVEPILFADDTSFTISSRNFEDFCSVSNLVLSLMIKRFVPKKLLLNLDKANIMNFIPNNLSRCTLHVGYKEQYIEETVSTDFFCLQIDNHLNWKNHVEQMISKLSGPCYAGRSMVHSRNTNTLKSIYYAYFHSIIKYGIIFCGNSSNSGKIFALQRKVFRIMFFKTQNFM